MQASTSRPYKVRGDSNGGQDTHAQFGPNQHMVVRWASSHNNTFTLAVVAGADQGWFFHKDYYRFVDDYIDSAPPGANEAIVKPRYHGSAGGCGYLNAATNTACAGGYCIKDLFQREVKASDAEYVGHKLDMSPPGRPWTHSMFTYNPDYVHNEEGYANGADWTRIPDRRVAYKSETYPWLVSAMRFHNKARRVPSMSHPLRFMFNSKTLMGCADPPSVSSRFGSKLPMLTCAHSDDSSSWQVNMHSDWDLVKLGLPAYVFTEEQVAAKGQHYIVHFSSRSSTDSIYTDAIDVHALVEDVDPDLIYGKKNADWAWTKTDHCQWTEPRGIYTPIQDATKNVLACHEDTQNPKIRSLDMHLAINTVPSHNPDVVSVLVEREVEVVDSLCTAGCAPDPRDPESKTAGYCRLQISGQTAAMCAAPTRVHRVPWANPLISNRPYDATTVAGAKAGEYIEFEWDDVKHDVWRVPNDLENPCNTSSPEFQASAEMIIPPSHHATIDQSTEDTFVDGRNRYQIPSDAGGTSLLFVCTVNGHCDAGQQLSVSVSSSPAVADPNLAEGVCAAGYKLCPDQSKQGETVATVATNVNLPLSWMRGAETLQLFGKSNQASTPWHNFKYRKVDGKRCRWRPQNMKGSKWGPASAGIDHSNAAVWEFPDHELRDIVEACSSSHPEACTGFSWKGRTAGGAPGGATENHTASATSTRKYSSAKRSTSLLGGNAGWLAIGDAKGQWMELDLGEDKELSGVVTQASGPGILCPQANGVYERQPAGNVGVGDLCRNFRARWDCPTGCTATNKIPFCYPDGGKKPNYGVCRELEGASPGFGVTSFKIQYKTAAGAGFKEFDAVFRSVDIDYLKDEWSSNQDKQFKAFFPRVVAARYIRFVVQTFVGKAAMRADVLLHTSTDMFSGKHLFRRCLETDRFTRVVKVPPLTDEEARGFLHPKHFVKSIECPGCYQCREMVLVPGSVAPRQRDWSSYRGGYAEGFNIVLSNGGSANATLTVSLPEPMTSLRDTNGYKLTWGNHNPEFICKVDPTSAGPGPAEPDLEADEEWTTFLPPLPEDPATEDVIDAIANGFHPAEAVRDFESKDQANLAAIYPPGQQLDPAVTAGPYDSRNWLNLTSQAAAFTLPPRTLAGERGGYWPPKPAAMVTFMPVPSRSDPKVRWYPRYYNSYEKMVEFREQAIAMGWHVDSGAADADHTHSVTGETLTYGWRCTPRIDWFESSWNEFTRWSHGGDGAIPPYAFGAAKDVGAYCPDGQSNAWEVAVPSGVYTVTVAMTASIVQGTPGCTFENVRSTPGGKAFTNVFSVEVSDGRFTLSAAGGACKGINWIKLDLVSSKLYPTPWLPAPQHEWWQMELDDPTADVGLVELRLPHEAFATAYSFPSNQEGFAPDCRQFWLYAPAKCYRMFMYAQMKMYHPDLATYPNFPGFSQPFLEWYFDIHDTDSNGELHYEEFRAAQSQQALTGTYAMWERPYGHNVKGTSGYHDDNAAHLWRKLDVMHKDYGNENETYTPRGDSKITKDEWVHGMLSQPQSTFCNLFDRTGKTHGGNLHTGEDAGCERQMHGPIAEHWGVFPDDGNHGFVVSVSNTPCTDAGGCPTGTGASVCEFRNYHTSTSPAKVNCKGAKGKYVQVALPGDGNRLLPKLFVRPHRASIPLAISPDPILGGKNDDGAVNLTQCLGQCDSDYQCASGLECFQRDGSEAIPGCREHGHGGGSQVGWNYCYDPKYASTPETKPATVEERAEAIKSTNPDLQMSCYTVEPRSPPDADANDLLAATKLHPKTIVSNNPSDPIFWSTCYDRVKITEWLPLLGAEGEGDAIVGAAYTFNNGTFCLDCESVRLNHNNGSYDMAKMSTPRWWLQPKGQCQNCDAIVFGVHTSTTTSTSTSSTTSTSTSTSTATRTSTTTSTSTKTTMISTTISTPLLPSGRTTVGTTTDSAQLTKVAFATALASAGVDTQTADTIIAAVWQTMDLHALVTLASTDGLAAVLALPAVTKILAGRGLEESTVAAAMAAATAAEVEANRADVDAGGATEAKKSTGAIVGGVIASIGLLFVIVGFLQAKKVREGAPPDDSASLNPKFGNDGESTDPSGGMDGIVIPRQSFSSVDTSDDQGLGGIRRTSHAFENPVYDGVTTSTGRVPEARLFPHL